VKSDEHLPAKALLILLSALLDLSACGETDGTASDASSTVASSGAEETGFQPLQSVAVKDAMHRALRSGETQRWQDGAWSGYAVPGAAGANGCRGIRYTVDQRPEVPFESITACDGN
jgi:hypothetical protein